MVILSDESPSPGYLPLSLSVRHGVKPMPMAIMDGSRILFGFARRGAVMCPYWAIQLTEAGPDASLTCLYYTYLYRMEEMELLTGRDVAQVLKVSESMAYQLMRTDIPCAKLGRSVRVRPQDLEEYISSKVVAPETPVMLISNHRYR
jgi:predicted DNA-binding transcriptional regulator AlpA